MESGTRMILNGNQLVSKLLTYGRLTLSVYLLIWKQIIGWQEVLKNAHHASEMHVRIQKVSSEKAQLFSFFLLMRGDKIKIRIKVGHHWPASKTQLKW